MENISPLQFALIIFLVTGGIVFYIRFAISNRRKKNDKSVASDQ